jgi:hypothetical protein
MGTLWLPESFLYSLEKERITKQVYRTRDLIRADLFEYIDVRQSNPTP